MSICDEKVRRWRDGFLFVVEVDDGIKRDGRGSTWSAVWCLFGQ